MKFSIVNKLKIWLIITLSVLLVGMVLFGVLGYNKSIDYRTSNEIDVKVFSVNDSKDCALTTANDYFDSIKLKDKEYAFSSTVDGDGFVILKYKFDKSVETVNTQTLKSNIETALEEKGLTLEVEVNVLEAKNSIFPNTLWLSISLLIAIVVIFVYLFFTEKLASALSVIISGVVSILLFISMMAITRIPASPFDEIMESVSAIVTMILSAGLVVRFREEMKNTSNAKLSYKEIADKAVNAGVLRYIVISAFMLLASVLLIAIGKGYFRFLGLQLLVVNVVSIFSSFIWTPILWSLLKKENKGYEKSAKSLEE